MNSSIGARMTREMLRPGHDAQNEFRLASRVGEPVIRVRSGQPLLQRFVLPSNGGMADQVISKQQPLPMLLKNRATRDHMDMMRAVAAKVALDKKGVPRWNVVANRGSPEVVVPSCCQNGSDFGAGRLQTCYLDQHVNDRLRGETGHRGATKVFDPSDKAGRQTCTQVLSFLPEQLGPDGIVRRNRHFFPQALSHSVFQQLMKRLKECSFLSQI